MIHRNNKNAWETGRYSLTYIGLSIYAFFSLTSMALMNVAVGFLLICLLLDRKPHSLLREIRDLFLAPQLKLYLFASLFLMGACIVSLISAQWFPLAFGGRTVSMHWLKDLGKLWYFVFPVFLVLAWRRLSDREYNNVLRVWILAFGLLSALGPIQFFTGCLRPMPNPLLPGFFHPVLLLGHHLSVANIWIFPFFASLDIFFDPLLFKQLRVPRGLFFIILSLGLFVLIFSYSRTLWVALPLGLLAWMSTRLPKKYLVADVLFLIGATGILSQTPWIQSRLHSQMGIGERLSLWRTNFIFFQNRPIFGVGLGKNQDLTSYYFKWHLPYEDVVFVGHAHNVYLELLAGIGVVGLLAWCIWIGVQFALLHRIHHQKTTFNFAPGLLGAWIVFLVNGVTQVNFWEGKVLHQVMWVVGLTLFWTLRAPSPSLIRDKFA